MRPIKRLKWEGAVQEAQDQRFSRLANFRMVFGRAAVKES
jgi:hypothetical protein